MSNKNLLVILGQTASGKSELAVRLAKRFNGEIISADSRQVYCGMDIGTGKVIKDKRKKLYYYKGIRHYLLDVASPKKKFTAVKYKKMALSAINEIFNKEKLPILCGGAGFYIQTVIDGTTIPEVKPDWKLRKQLEKFSVKELFKKLKKLDKKRAKTIDKNNKRRLIRSLEIIIKTKKPVPVLGQKKLPYPVLIIGIKKDFDKLKKLIKKRLLKRLDQGMVKEVKKLRKSGISWKRLEEFGLEYRFVAYYLQNKISYQEMISLLQKEIEHYAKRQMTWFKHQFDDSTAQNFLKKNFGKFKKDSVSEQVWRKTDKRINWVKNYKEAEKLAIFFLAKK